MKIVLIVAWGWFAAMAGAQVPGLDFQTGYSHPLGLIDLAFGQYSRVVDLDGNGRLDVLGNLFSFIADGDGAYIPVSHSVGPVAPLDGSCVGDLDGDGFPDVFSYDQVALNTGSGDFLALPGGLPVLPPSACGSINVFRHPVMGDFDGDGDNDVFAPEPFGCGVLGGVAHMLLNDGTGRLSVLPAAIPGTAFEPTFATALDLDLDLDLDVVLTTSSATLVFLNDGSAAFTVGLLLGSGLGADRAAVGDFNGDGRPDFALHRAGVLEAVLSVPGGFASPVFSTLPAGVNTMESVDLDLDGQDELAWCDADGLAVAPFAPGGSLGAATVRYHFKNRFPGSGRVVVGDLDHDGDEDVLVDAEYRTRTFLSDGQGVLEELARHDMPVAATLPGAVGDFDADGDVDLVARESLPGGGTRLGIMVNDGFGNFAIDPTTWSGVPTAVGDVAHVFDANGDAFPDLYIAAAATNPAPDLMLTNVGAGFVVTTTLPGIGQTVRIEDADLDGDGDRDLILARGQTTLSHHYVLDNNGGVLAAPRNLSPTMSCNNDMAIGDVDGDLDVDVIVACVSMPARLFLNDGTGLFSSGQTFSTPLALSCSLGDFDGDGDLDATIGAAVWANDGTGAFTFHGQVASGAIPNACQVLDVDEDGDLDLLDFNSNAWLNQGGASMAFSFAPVNAWIPTGNTLPHAKLVDVDRDGDRDAIVDGHVYHNLSRQLTSRGLRQLGAVEKIDVHVRDSGVIYWLFVSLTTVDIPLPPFGSLFVDPNASAIHASGSVPSFGLARVPVPIPANPALVGVEVHWQALTTNGLDTHLSNLHSIVIRP